MADRTVESLLDVLSLLGFNEGESLANELIDTCKDEESKEVLQLLAEHLRAEHVPSLKHQLSGVEYQPNSAEKAVAKKFATQLQAQTEEADSAFQGHRSSEAQHATAALLCNASKQLEKELTKDIEVTRAGIQRSELEVERLRKQADDEVLCIEAEVAQLDRALQGLAQAMTGSTEAGTFLCLNGIGDFKELDQEVLTRLKDYWAAQISGANDKVSSTQILEVDCPGLLPSNAARLLCGEGEGVVASRALEVDRIRKSYSVVLEGNIRMKALQAKQDATLQALKGGLSRPELASQNADFLLGETKGQQKLLDNLLLRKQQLLTEDLPEICSSLGSFQCMEIVKAELETELHRNRFYSAKKRAISEFVTARAARTAALIAEARNEATSFRVVQETLQALSAQADAINGAVDIRSSRQEAFEQMQANPPDLPSSVKKAPSESALSEGQSNIDALLHSLTEATIPRLLGLSGELHSYAFSTADHIDPVMSSTDLLDARKQLEVAQKQLGNATDKVFQQQETYNSVMRTNTEQVNAEREVFYKFYTKPQGLLKDMKTLQNAVKGKAGQGSPRRTPRTQRAGHSNA